MSGPLRSLFLVTITVLLGSILAWFLLRSYGYSKALQEPVHHPFTADLKPGHPVLISYGGEDGYPDNTLEAFDAAIRKDHEAILWADVRPAADGTLFLFRQVDLAQTTNGTGWVDYTSPDDLRKLNAGFRFKSADGTNPYLDHPVRIPTLVEFLEHFPTQKLVLNFLNNRPGLDAKIMETLDRFKVGPRALIQSPEDGLLRDLRKQKPDWLFGTSQAKVTQLKMLSTLGLAPLASLPGDVYVTEAELAHNSMLDDDMRAELFRRKMPIFIGPVQDKGVAIQFLRHGVSGIITKNVLVLVQ